MNHFLVNGRYKDMLEYYKIDVHAVLKKAMLPGDILNRRSITMKEEQYYRFLDAIEMVGNVPGLSVFLATTDKIEQFSPPIFASFCSKNARMCFERLAKYKKLIGPMRMELSEENGKYGVELLPGNTEYQLPAFLVESEIAFMVNMIRRATKDKIIPVEITTAVKLKDSALEDFAGVKVAHGERNQLIFDSEDMDIPFISFDESMWEYFKPELNRRLSELDVDDTISTRVRAALKELLPAGICSVDDVASELGLSKRTLQRKLSEEHTTFQKQLNNTREMLALHYLQNTDMSPNDIAFLLGYAELNSFFRAFTVWTGKNLSTYRNDK